VADVEAGPVPPGLVVPSAYGPVLADRHDTHQTAALVRMGHAFDHGQIVSLCAFLGTAPEGAVAVDVGANFGLFALAFGRCRASRGGRVHAFEAQRMIAYLAAGTAALNGVENVFVHHQAVADRPGRVPIPQFDYNATASFGSVEFGPEQREFIGQPRRADPDRQEWVEVVRLDDLGLRGVHLAMADVEGMEEAVLRGAAGMLERDTPVLCVEHLKSDKDALVRFCKRYGYRVFDWGADYSGPQKLDHQLSYSGGPGKGYRWRASGSSTRRRSRPRSPWRPSRATGPSTSWRAGTGSTRP
jgi:FkbM family methyltransferase